MKYITWHGCIFSVVKNVFFVCFFILFNLVIIGGSDYIETSTYQASVTGFVKYMNVTEEEALALIRKSVELAAEAVKLYREEFPSKNKMLINFLIT